MIRCKMKVESRAETKDGCAVVLTAVHSGSPENEKFFKFTPSAQMNLSLVVKETAKYLDPGKEYYIDITEAE